MTLRPRDSMLWHRAQNRWWDFRAWSSGYCNHCPWRPEPGRGGYSFWRCALKHGHDGLHRYRSYVWSADGSTDYLPLPPSVSLSSQPWDRSATPRRRDVRERLRASRPS